MQTEPTEKIEGRRAVIVSQRRVEFERAEFSQPMPRQANSPMYLLVNLALGGGWPIEATPNPRHIMVDYVRAYVKAAP